MINRNWKRFTVVAASLVFLFGVGVLSAQDQEGYHVDYRLVRWKTMHFHDAKKAELHFKTVKDLGCAAKKASHGDHIDVMYRCPNWRRITLRSDASAHSWQRWLRGSGFETKHQH